MGRYRGKGENCYIKHIHYGYHNCTFVELIRAETSLRKHVQYCESLSNQSTAQIKLTPEDQKAIQESERKLKCAEATLRIQEYRLYKMETLLPAELGRMYMSLRRNPTWYYRTELVEYCIARGGCCSRDCGCCANRRSKTKNISGIGHCTLYSGCCSDDRGSSFTHGQHEEIRKRLKDMLYSDTPAFLLKMMEAHFTEPVQPRQIAETDKTKKSVFKPWSWVNKS